MKTINERIRSVGEYVRFTLSTADKQKVKIDDSYLWILRQGLAAILTYYRTLEQVQTESLPFEVARQRYGLNEWCKHIENLEFMPVSVCLQKAPQTVAELEEALNTTVAGVLLSKAGHRMQRIL